MINIWKLRIFYRGLKAPQRPYFYNKWGVISFGVSIIGIMFFKLK
jgi:hypothetical protein